VFNVTGSELVIILLVALIVLGPEKLPDAIRKVGRVYGELRRMSAGFQSELKDALDEPMREMRDTMNTVKGGFNFGDDGEAPATATPSEGPRLSPQEGAAPADLTEPAEAADAPETAVPAEAAAPVAANANPTNASNAANGNGTPAAPPVVGGAPPVEEPAAPADND
jgi:sec-independent protein translocase protein TatB